jgi:hypothetical protein
MIDRKEILDVFSMLNKNQISYVLLRNIDKELPDNLKEDKDIDILVKHEDKGKFQKVLYSNGFKKKIHPWDFGNNFIFLYAMDKLEFYSKGDINLDICYQLCCRSINAKEWMPIDQLINNSVWENKRCNKRYDWFELSYEDELVHLLTRCIFDKGEFNFGYRKRITELMRKVDMTEEYKRLNVVFFKFSYRLIELIEKNEFDKIVNEYMTFTEY